MIKINKPVYYWCSYWQKWDEIIGWNPLNQYIIVREVGKDKIREHCTTMNKQHISLNVIVKNKLERYENYIEKVAEQSNDAWKVLMTNGMPKYIQRLFK